MPRYASACSPWVAWTRRAQHTHGQVPHPRHDWVGRSAGVPPGKSQIVLRDMRPVGLGLRLRPGGSASWIYVYRPKGSPRGTPPRTVTLGTWPTLDLDAARREALKHVGKVAGGGDPPRSCAYSDSSHDRGYPPHSMPMRRNLPRRKVVARSEAMSILRRGFAPMLDEDIGAIDQPMLIARITAIATSSTGARMA